MKRCPARNGFKSTVRDFAAGCDAADRPRAFAPFAFDVTQDDAEHALNAERLGTPGSCRITRALRRSVFASLLVVGGRTPSTVAFTSHSAAVPSGRTGSAMAEEKKKGRGHERRCGAEARAGNLKDIQEFCLNSAPYFLSLIK